MKFTVVFRREDGYLLLLLAVEGHGRIGQDVGAQEIEIPSSFRSYVPLRHLVALAWLLLVRLGAGSEVEHERACASLTA